MPITTMGLEPKKHWLTGKGASAFCSPRRLAEDGFAPSFWSEYVIKEWATSSEESACNTLVAYSFLNYKSTLIL
jgi:hypothetical protein